MERVDDIYDREFLRLQRTDVLNDQNVNEGSRIGTSLKRFVTFYYTNVPEFIPYFNLRQGFEVCGVLEDLFVSRKYNAQGKIYGFVRYSNVRNVDKLTKALNAVTFGVFQVFAKVARFDRFERKGDGRMKVVSKRAVEGGKSVSAGDSKEGGGVQNKGREMYVSRGGKAPIMASDVVCFGAVQGREGLVFDGEKEGEVAAVRKVREKVVHMQQRSRSVGGVLDDALTNSLTLKGKEVSSCNQRLVIKYRTDDKDVSWACNGVVASVLNGESIPLIQQRILDAGFNTLNIIPLGADRVLLKSCGEEDVNSILSGASEFFMSFFSSVQPWNNDNLKFERGAWVRLYGIPLHAWNNKFFKLCVFDHGRLMRVDTCTVERERMDYARILLATSSLNIINDTIDILVDDGLVTVKLLEEAGISIGEDACLFDDEYENEDCVSVDDKGDFIMNDDVDNLVKELAEDWVEENNKQSNNVEVNQFCDGADVSTCKYPAINSTSDVSATASSSENSPRPASKKGEVSVHVQGSVEQIREAPNAAIFNEEQAGPFMNDASESSLAAAVQDANKRNRVSTGATRSKRTSSCPPGRTRSILSGPWSVEWLSDHHHGDASIISSLRKKSMKDSVSQERKHDTRKKNESVLRHPMVNIKKVARLPTKDRSGVLKELKKQVHKRRGGIINNKLKATKGSDSSSSGTPKESENTDWRNWVVLHGNDEIAVEDVWGIRKAIGVKFTGDKANMFNVLSRGGRKSGRKEVGAARK